MNEPNESPGYTENREDEDPAVSAFDKQHDDMLPNVPEDEDCQAETVPDATNLPAHPIRSQSPSFPPEDTPDDTLYDDIFREQRQPDEPKPSLPEPEAERQAVPETESMSLDSRQVQDSIRKLETLCANLQDILTACQSLTTTLKEADAILAETLHTLSAETQSVTANRQAYEKIMTEMSRTAHWLEHTNKRYTEMMAAMPIQAEKAYTGMIQKHAANYQNLMIKLGKLIETKVIKPPKATNYYAIAGILLVQTIALYVLLK